MLWFLAPNAALSVICCCIHQAIAMSLCSTVLLSFFPSSTCVCLSVCLMAAVHALYSIWGIGSLSAARGFMCASGTPAPNLVQVQGSSGPLHHNKCCLNVCALELGAVLFSFSHRLFHWWFSCFSTIQLSPLLFAVHFTLVVQHIYCSQQYPEAPGNSCGDCAWLCYMGEAPRVAGLQGQ